MAVIDLAPARLGLQVGGPVRARSPVDAGALAAPGAALAAAGADLANIAREERRARDADAAATARTEFSLALTDARVRAERGEFGEDFRGGFEARAAELLRDASARITSPEARAQFQRFATTDTAELTRGLIIRQATRTAEMSEANALRDLEGLAQAAAAAPDEAARRVIIAQAAEAISTRVASGAIAAPRGEALRQDFVSRLDEARVRRLITDRPADAARLLADDGQFTGLRPERRAALLDTATRRADSEADRAIRAADIAERRADRLARTNADRAANDFLSRLDAARRGEPGAVLPSREDLDRHRDYLSPGEYRSLLETLRREPPERDSPQALIDLQPRVHTEDPAAFRRDAARALERGEIRPETYRSLVQQNEAARRDDAPASAYRSGRGFVADGLDPGNVVGGEFIRGPLATARQNALADFDTWAERNPRATREEAVQKAQELVSRYQQGAQAQSRLSLPRPFGYTGGRDGINEDAIRRAAAALEQARADGRIGGAEFTREVQIIRAWQSLPAPTAPRQQRDNPRGNGPRL